MNNVEREKSEIRQFSEEITVKVREASDRTTDSIKRLSDIEGRFDRGDPIRTELMTIEVDLKRIRQLLILVKAGTDSIVSFSDAELNEINREVTMLSEKLEEALER